MMVRCAIYEELVIEAIWAQSEGCEINYDIRAYQ